MTYDPAALFAALAERRIEYVLIGGWAVNAHGYRRFTGDVDICPAPDASNLTRLAGLVRDLGGRQLGLDDFGQEELPGADDVRVCDERSTPRPLSDAAVPSKRRLLGSNSQASEHHECELPPPARTAILPRPPQRPSARPPAHGEGTRPEP
jgi:hypothetical protein